MNTKEIDLVAYDEKLQMVNLVLMDDLNWDDLDDHLVLLQEKILTYVNFIENDDLTKKYPSKSGLDIEIKVVFENNPPESGERFINQVLLILEETGHKLSYINYNDK